MADYFFPAVNLTMTNPNVVKQGKAGGTFANDVSIGGFYCDLLLSTTKAEHKFRLISLTTQPVSFSVEDISTWVLAELDSQFLVV